MISENSKNRKETRAGVFCFVLPSFFIENKGGAELQCYYLARELIQRGWQVHYIREYRPQYPDKSYIYQGIHIHCLSRRRNTLRWLNTRRLKYLMQRIRADVYYARASVSYIWPLVKNAEVMDGSRVIWACSHDNELRPPQKRGKWISHLLTRINHRLFTSALPRTGLILLQTQDQKRILKNEYDLNGKVLYNAHPRSCRLQVPSTNDIVLWIGRLQEWKHPERFIELARRFSRSPYRFIAIGKPLKGNRLQEEMKAAQEMLPNFTFTGELDNETVREFMSKARLMVCTSDAEGFSNTFLEAWAQGVPVVSLHVNPDRLITSCRIGRVSGTMDRLIRDIELLMRDDKEWKQLSDNSIAFYNSKLTIERYTDQFEKFIREESNG